jgi:DUF438 domain-containing protein
MSERKSFDKQVKDFQREFFKEKLGSAMGMLEYLDEEHVIKAVEVIEPIIEHIGFAFPEDCVCTCCKVINYVFGIDTSKWLEEYKNLTKISLTGDERVKDYKPIEETGFYRDRKRRLAK